MPKQQGTGTGVTSPNPKEKEKKNERNFADLFGDAKGATKT